MRNKSDLPTKDHISENQAAHLLDVSRYRVLHLAAAGQLHPVAVAGRLIYPRGEVIALRQRLADEAAARSSE
jgi:hypothetical protein